MKTLKTVIALLLTTCLVVAGVDIKLEWEPVAPRAGESISYRVYKQSGTNWVYVVGVATTNATVANVANGTHTFAVKAVNNALLESVLSNPVTTTINDFQSIPPTAPNALRITVIVTPP